MLAIKFSVNLGPRQRSDCVQSALMSVILTHFTKFRKSKDQCPLTLNYADFQRTASSE